MSIVTRRQLLATASAGAATLAMPNIVGAATRRLRIAHNNNVGSVIHTGAESFAKAVASLSGGSLAMDVFPSAQLGNEQQLVKAVADGTLDAVVVNVGPIAEYLKEVGLIELPYLFRDINAARAALDGQLGAYYTDALKAKGFFVAGWGENGLRHMTANKPLRTPADLKGLKLRVQVSIPTLETFRAIGAQAEILPFPQLVEALRTGRFEAQENPIGIVISSNLNKVQSHLSLTGHVYAPMLITMSNDVFDELSPADKAVIGKAAAVGVKAMRDFADNADKAGLAALKTAGMTVIEDVDRAAFKDAAAAAKARLTEVYGADVLKRFSSYAV